MQYVVKRFSEARWTVTFKPLNATPHGVELANYPVDMLDEWVRRFLLNPQTRNKTVFIYKRSEGRIVSCRSMEKVLAKREAGKKKFKSKAQLKAERQERQHQKNIDEFLKAERETAEALRQSVDAAREDVVVPPSNEAAQ